MEGTQIDGRIGPEERAYLDILRSNYSDATLGGRQRNDGERLQSIIGAASTDTGVSNEERAAYVAAGIDMSQFIGLSSVRLAELPESITPDRQPEGTTAPTRSNGPNIP